MDKRALVSPEDGSSSSQNKHQKLMASNEIDPQSFARSYQIDALEKAMKQNTIVYLETGSGKTLIAIMLIRSYAHQIRKPSPFIAVFLVPTVHLVTQQAGVVDMYTDLKVGKYWGDLGVDFWDACTWKNEIEQNEVMVMTPRILLDGLRHGFFKLDMIKLMIFDECHNARGKSDYACILKEFYHPQLRFTPSRLPRILGMTACLIKSKGAISPQAYAKQILEFENLMNSKVFTVVSESVLAEFIPFSATKVKLYKHVDIPKKLSSILEQELTNLRLRYTKKLKDDSEESAVKTISKLCDTYMFCLTDLGVWLACEAAKSLSCTGTDIYFWEQRDGGVGQKTVRSFSKDVFEIFSGYIPSGSKWFNGDDIKANLEAGLLTSRVTCLIESLMEYRVIKDLRCIVFVERVITAIVLQSLLSEVLLDIWSVTYMAGNRTGLKSQRRNEHLDIINSFREGAVNIIVATQILEEGLDVQRCNLVIRFDPSTTVCSFIQSRGRARMEGSDYLLIVQSGDASEFSRVNNYLASGEIMREESLRYSSLPCAPLEGDIYDEELYCVETTGALVSLSSSVALVYYYCSHLPSDGYFKPTPRFTFDEEFKLCTLHLPNSCPLQKVSVQGPKDILKKLVCLEACKKLHEMGALTDNLLPESVEDKSHASDIGDLSYEEEQVNYFPEELVLRSSSEFEEWYHCYTITMKQNFDYDVKFRDVILAVKCDLGKDLTHMCFELVANRGSVNVIVASAGKVHLSAKQVTAATKFQATVLSLLIDRNLNKVVDAMDCPRNEILPRVHYLLLPSCSVERKSLIIDWDCIRSLCFPDAEVCSSENTRNYRGCLCPVEGYVHTKEKVLCRCKLNNSLVFTPHNGSVYCTTGFLDGLDGNSIMKSDKDVITYKNYYKSKHGINLQHEGESLLSGRHIFTVQNCFRRQKRQKEKVMRRLESILLALNLKKVQTDHCISNIDIPTIKVLEAITTKKCQEEFCLESLETLGDSFLKYSVCQQLFRRNKYHHEGLLSSQKDRMVSNNTLCKLGCQRKLEGFIRNEYFDPKQWVIPGDLSKCSRLDEISHLTSGNIYVMGLRCMKSKVIADVVEGLIGAYLITGGESAALLFLDWLGLKVDFIKEIPNDKQFITQPEKFVNVNHLEALLNYKFQEPSLLVEALTHGSYQLPDISRCYQRLEFLGDSVLDYLITVFMYSNYPGISPGQLTDLRSSAVNNDCYAFAAVKVGLHKHILHASSILHEQIKNFVRSFGQLSLHSTYGWESETTVPKALGDIIESLAGAIFVDSGYSTETVWKSMRPILEPLASPDTMKLHPVKELGELCQREGYESSSRVSSVEGKASFTIEVEANGIVYSDTRTGMDKKTAKKLAAKTVLEKLKASMARDS